MTTPSKVKGEFYVLLKVERGWWGDKPITGLKAVAVRQGKPSVPRGHVAVRVTLNFDRRSVEESIPAVEADVQTFVAPAPELEVA